MKLHLILAKRLKQLMNENDAMSTHERLGRVSQVSRSSIQRILQGDQNVTLKSMEKLAAAFRIKPNHFLLEADEVELLKFFKDFSPAEKRQYLQWLADSVQQKKNLALEFNDTSPMSDNLTAPALREASSELIEGGNLFNERPKAAAGEPRKTGKK